MKPNCESLHKMATQRKTHLYNIPVPHTPLENLVGNVMLGRPPRPMGGNLIAENGPARFLYTERQEESS